jgi:hypothetical protein
MIPVRQSTAFETSIGPVLDADGVAVTNGVVADLKIKKTTGNFAALNGSATLTHVSAGVYDLVLTTSDLDTVGLTVIAMDDTVNACAPLYLQVMEEAVYDALYAASANAFTGAAGSTKVTGVVLVDTLTTYTGNTVQTGDSYARLGAPAGASVSADIAAIEAQTDDIGAAGAGLTAVPWNAAWDAEVQSECADALVAYDGLVAADLPANFASLGINASGHISRVTLVDTTTTNTDMRGTDNAATAANLATVAGYLDTEVAAILAAVDTEIAALIATVGVAGAGLTAVPWNAAWDAEVQSEVIDALQETVPDTVPADGTRPNMQQAAYMSLQTLIDVAISGTTMTVRKVDGSTALFTVTLNDATTPTAKTRAT